MMEETLLAISWPWEWEWPSWSQIFEESSDFVGNVVAWSLIIIGFIGTFMPIVPGPVLILIGAVVHRIWLGAEESLGWVGLTILGVLLTIAIVFENIASAMGAKWYGATKWGMWGAIFGGLVGIFFHIPGLIFGPLIGAFVGEMLFAKKRIGDATKSTWGTFVGIVVGILIKAFIAFAMLATILTSILWKPS